MNETARIAVIVLGVLLYQLVQWNEHFMANRFVETIGILLVVLALATK